MTIHIEELTFECIIGILDFERTTPQVVVIDVEIEYEYRDELFINYAEVIALLEKEMIQNRYELLETALNQLAQKLHLKYASIKNLNLKIAKPNIIKNAKVSLSKSFTFI